MATEQNKRAVIVGLFVFFGIAIFVVTVFTLGSQQKAFQKNITVKAIFADVQGLQRGNNVWFSGVKIGTVKRLVFVGNSKVEVDINIDEKSKEYIRKDAMAKVSSDGLIGNKIIVIYGGTEKAASVEGGETLGVETAFSSDELMNTLQSNNKNLLAITNDLKVVTGKLNKGEGTIGKLLSDETLVGEMQQVVNTFNKAAQNTNDLTRSLSSYTAKLNQKGTLTSDLISDTVVFARLRSAAVQLDQLTQSTGEVITELKSAGNALNNGLGNKSTPIGLMLNDTTVAEDLRLTMKNLQTSTEKLDENMEALQHNFLLRGFFRKKEKREKAAQQ